MGQEEGRIRFKPAVGSIPASFIYDYFLKDHLGNVRMVLTEDQQIDHYPTATLEGTGAGSPVEMEKTYYDINTSYVQSPPASLTTNYINDNGTNNLNTFGNRNANSQKMYRLNAATNRTGLGMVLKVMAGDKINVLGKSYYHYSGGTVSNTPFDASALITAFLGVGGSSNVAASHGATTTLLNANTAGTITPVNLFTNGNSVNSNNNVKAGIAYILFDEQFKYAGGGFDPVDASPAGALKSHVLPDINVPKNGYIYIYCSNESNIDVFFDNLEVKDTRGAILEETHYYPFGLTMAGISSRAAGIMQNRYKFNGGNELQNAEFSDGSGLETYDAINRMYDPQIGRFFQPDELPESHWEITPYNFAANNPFRFNDPLGLEEGDPNKPKDLANVTVSATRKWTFEQKQSLYWKLREQQIGFDKVKSPKLREWLKNWDGTARWLETYHAGVKEDGYVILEVASWFIPLGELTKLRYIKYATNLFKLRRGIQSGVAAGADIIAQTIVNKGDFKKFNPVSTLASAILGHPLMASIPGAFVNLSYDRISNNNVLSSASDINVYKTILLTTAGNMSGDYFYEKVENKLGSTPSAGITIGGATLTTSGAADESIKNE